MKNYVSMASCSRFIMEHKFQSPQEKLNCEPRTYNVVTLSIKPSDHKFDEFEASYIATLIKRELADLS